MFFKRTKRESCFSHPLIHNRKQYLTRQADTYKRELYLTRARVNVSYIKEHTENGNGTQINKDTQGLYKHAPAKTSSIINNK